MLGGSNCKISGGRKNMLGGSNCKISGGKNKSKGGSACKIDGGAKKKNGKKRGEGKKRGVKKRKGGGFCIGNLHPYEDSVSSNNSLVPASASLPTPMPIAASASMSPEFQMEGGAKKRKAGPYAKFVKKHFASVQKKHPSWKATDCMKEIAKMWRAQKK
jgi:hypothetical protein